MNRARCMLSSKIFSQLIYFLIYSYLLNVPFNNDDGTGIVYAWIGSKSDPEDARLIEEIAEAIFNNVSYKFFDTNFYILQKIHNSLIFKL